MSSIQNDELSEIITDEVIVKKEKTQKNDISLKKKNHFFAYLYLFAFVFIGALWGLSMVIKSYTPQIDVSVGNNEQFDFFDSDNNTEMKTIDERLKYIQMEDDLPSVSILSSEKAAKDRNEIKEDKTEDNMPQYRNQKIQEQTIKIEQVKPIEVEIAKETIDRKEALKNKNTSEGKIIEYDFKSIPTKEIIPMPKPLITKIYLGNYSTKEDAQKVQEKIISIEPGLAPFVKTVNNYYIVQIGSFSSSERASVLIQKLRENGYYPKVKYEN